MRILRLDAPDDGYAVEFHPFVTVVAGLSDEQRAMVGAAFQDAIAGRPPALGGLIEVHGVVLDLDAESLALLELDGVDVDAIVEVADLPGAASAGLDGQLRAAERRLESLELPYREHARALEAAEEAVEAARTALQSARQEAEDVRAHRGGDLDALRAALAEAEETLAALADPWTRAANELEQAERVLAEIDGDRPEAEPAEVSQRRQELEARRAELVAGLDAEAADAFEEALAALRDVEDRLASGPVPATGRPADEPELPDEDDPSGIESRIEEIRGLIALHASFDPSQVRAALDAVRMAPSAGELVPSPEAIGLADRLELTERRIAELHAGARDETLAPGAVDAAAAALRDIRAEVLALEQATAPSTLEADIAELDRIHAEVVDARERLDGRFGKSRAQARYDAAVAAEEAVLERLGIRSYTDLMTGGRLALQAESEPIELRRLRRREREAEEELQALQARARLEVDLAEAEQDLRALRGRARTLLADAEIPDDDLVRALLALRVPAVSSTPHDELLEALEAVGLPVRSLELSRDDAEAMAADWLDEYYRAEDRKAALEQQLAALEERSGGEQAEPMAIVPDAPPQGSATGEPDGTDEERLAEAQQAVRAAKERMIAHETAARELATLEVELEELEGEEGRWALRSAERAAAERRVAEARTAVEDLDDERVAADARLLEARAAVEQRTAADSARLDDVVRRLRGAEDDLAAAEAALEATRHGFDLARAGYDAAVEEVAALRQALADVSNEPAPVEEIEWYLLARLAAQRHVSFAGSVPIVVDRALDALDEEGLLHLLDRLERMAGAVQVVHISDDERILRWAVDAGEDRAAVVRPIVSVDR